MIVTLIRTAVLYGVVILSVRLMGKRQVGELQPGELVITIMISECAAAPIQDLNRPVLNGIIAIFTLVILEILLSRLTLRWPWLRHAVDGRPRMVIRDGQPDQAAMKQLRLSLEDLMSALRQTGVFALEEVACCLAETDGKLSVLPVADQRPATAGMVQAHPVADMPCLVVADGTVQPVAMAMCGMNEAALTALLQKEKTPRRDVFALTVYADGRYTLIRKEGRP